MSAARLVEWPMRSISSRRLAPGLSDQDIPGVAQVVKVNVQAGRGEGGEPDTATEVWVPQQLASRAREQQRVGTGWREGVQV